MNKKQIETLLHYVTIAIKQANNFEDAMYIMSNSNEGKNELPNPLSRKEIDALETRKSMLENLLKDTKDNCLRCGKEDIDEYHICNSCTSGLI